MFATVVVTQGPPANPCMRMSRESSSHYTTVQLQDAGRDPDERAGSLPRSRNGLFQLMPATTAVRDRREDG